MQFKSARFCSKRFNRHTFLVIGLSLGMFSPLSVAHAVLTLTPVNGGPERVLPNGGSSIQTNGGGTFYYWVSYGSSTTSLGSNVFFLPGNASLPFNVIPPMEDRSDLSNMFVVNLSTSLTSFSVSAGQQVIVTLQAQGSAGFPNPPVYAPIAAVNGVACTDTNCQASSALLNPGRPRYYAAKFYPTQQASIQIGFYPNDICADFNTPPGATLGLDALGCSSGALTTATEGSPVTLQLRFNVVVASDTNYPPASGATPIDSNSNPLSLSFQVDTPSFSCPSEEALNTSWYPGDGQIFLNTTLFSMSGPAPAANLIVVGGISANGGAPILGSGYPASPLVQVVPLSGVNQGVGGFTNATESLKNQYQISFMGQDQTGLIAQSTASCVTNVQATAIQGFISKGNCFIATAAFQTADAPPVLLLREFRDHFLLSAEWGKAFVQWYYQWSPSAAAWLSAHPVFRLPVLLALGPLEWIAWIALHPFYLLVYLCVCLPVCLFLVLAYLGFSRTVKK